MYGIEMIMEEKQVTQVAKKNVFTGPIYLTKMDLGYENGKRVLRYLLRCTWDDTTQAQRALHMAGQIGEYALENLPHILNVTLDGILRRIVPWAPSQTRDDARTLRESFRNRKDADFNRDKLYHTIMSVDVGRVVQMHRDGKKLLLQERYEDEGREAAWICLLSFADANRAEAWENKILESQKDLGIKPAKTGADLLPQFRAGLACRETGVQLPMRCDRVELRRGGERIQGRLQLTRMDGRYFLAFSGVSKTGAKIVVNLPDIEMAFHDYSEKDDRRYLDLRTRENAYRIFFLDDSGHFGPELFKWWESINALRSVREDIYECLGKG